MLAKREAKIKSSMLRIQDPRIGQVGVKFESGGDAYQKAQLALNRCVNRTTKVLAVDCLREGEGKSRAPKGRKAGEN